MHHVLCEDSSPNPVRSALWNHSFVEFGDMVHIALEPDVSCFRDFARRLAEVGAFLRFGYGFLLRVWGIFLLGRRILLLLLLVLFLAALFDLHLQRIRLFLLLLLLLLMLLLLFRLS